MKYYIVKPTNQSVSEELLNGIWEVDPGAEFVNTPEECDAAILQHGWIRSKTAIAEKDRISCKLHKPCREGYTYTGQ